jgi:hypothetical protein
MRHEAVLCAGAGGTCLLLSFWSLNAVAEEVGCADSARLLHYACAYEMRASYHGAAAACADAPATEDACVADAAASYDEGVAECEEALGVRLDLCGALGDEPYEPAFGAAHASAFVDPREIGASVPPNPWFPLVPGNRWVYDDGEGATRTVTVTEDVKLVDGIECAVVNDVTTEGDVVVEETDLWLAQDLDGNVWTCGELARDYETFEGDAPVEPELVDIDGSWKAGRDGAEAGILVPAAAEPGVVLRHELAPGVAEDAFEVVSITATETAPAGACDGDCLETRELSPLDPGNEEHRYYAAGIGLIVATNDDERVELVEFEGVGQ